MGRMDSKRVRGTSVSEASVMKTQTIRWDSASKPTCSGRKGWKTRKEEGNGKIDVGQIIEGLKPQTEELGVYLEENRRTTWLWLVVFGRPTLGLPRVRWSVSGTQKWDSLSWARRQTREATSRMEDDRHEPVKSRGGRSRRLGCSHHIRHPRTENEL